MTALPLIFDIRRGTLDDGPGIRTTVFFKGCPLACVWCHNPESMAAAAELSFDSGRCLGAVCAACTTVCPGSKEPSGGMADSGCAVCGACTRVCPTAARRLIGRYWPLDELCEHLRQDSSFYRTSGGGVTLSGGEPTLHHVYIAALLPRLQAEGISTAIQTCGLFAFEPFQHDLLPYLDRIYFDLKFIDPHRHRQYTGRDNRTILANLALLAAAAPERLTVRLPLIPGITASEENIAAVARLVAELQIPSLELLGYNPGGIGKREHMRQKVVTEIPLTFMPRGEEERLRGLFQRASIAKRPAETPAEPT